MFGTPVCSSNINNNNNNNNWLIIQVTATI